MPDMKGDIYDVYVLLLLSLMLVFIGGTSIVIGEHQAR
jgi:hypothetical protein